MSRRASLAVLLALLLPCGAAEAAEPTGCAPLGSLPGYMPDPAQVREYDALEFRRPKPGSDEVETIAVAGRACTVSYSIQSGRDPMSDLEIQSNYRTQIERMGAQVLMTDDSNTVARLAKDGVETWMSVYSQSTSLELRVVRVQPPRVTITAPGPKDYRLLGHMPAYQPDTPVVRNFDQMEFNVVDGDDTRVVKVQGRTFTVNYEVRSGAAVASDPEIQFNYRDALAKLGAEILLTDAGNTTARLVSNGQVVWVKIYSQATSIQVSAVEEKPFEPSIKPPAPDALRAALDRTGRVALYVNFDFGKATLRPDAAPVVAQVLALLKADPNLKLAIEGHTDNLGTAELNQKLSEERAAAIVAALTAGGIAPARLASSGYGLSKPVASNDTSEGRARNRRVELVKR